MPDLVFASKGAAEVIRQQTLLNERASELQSIYRDDARAAQDLERAATRIFKNAQNPAKQFNEEVGKLLGNFKQGKINAEQYERGVRRLEDAYKQTQTISGKLQRSVDGLFGGKQVRQLAAFAGGVVSISSAIAALKSEYQSAVQLIDKASATQLSVAQSRNVVLRNTVGLSPEQQRQILTDLQKQSGALALPETVVNEAFASAYSASGGDLAASVAAVDFAGRYLADQPGSIPGFAGSLLDLRSLSGSQNPQVNAGLLAKVSQLSRVVDPAALARNAPRGLSSAGSYGATPQEAVALFAALTTATKDIEGASTSTALIQLSKQLNPTQDRSQTLGQRIAGLQGNRAAAEEFLSNASFEAAALAPIRNLLLDPTSEAARLYRQNLAQVPGASGLAQLSQQTLDSFAAANALEPAAQASRSLISLRDRLLVNSPQNLGAPEREALQDVLQLGGRSNLGARASTFLGQLGDASVGISRVEARDILQAEYERLSQPERTAIAGGTGAPGQVFERQRSDAEKETARLLGETVRVLNDQLEQQRQTNQKLDNSGIVAGGN